MQRLWQPCINLFPTANPRSAAQPVLHSRLSSLLISRSLKVVQGAKSSRVECLAKKIPMEFDWFALGRLQRCSNSRAVNCFTPDSCMQVIFWSQQSNKISFLFDPKERVASFKKNIRNIAFIGFFPAVSVRGSLTASVGCFRTVLVTVRFCAWFTQGFCGLFPHCFSDCSWFDFIFLFHRSKIK